MTLQARRSVSYCTAYFLCRVQCCRISVILSCAEKEGKGKKEDQRQRQSNAYSLLAVPVAAVHSKPTWLAAAASQMIQVRSTRVRSDAITRCIYFCTSCFTFSSQFLSTEQEEMPRPQTSQKGSAGLLPCSRILLPRLRERISD